jgi:putative transposase
MKPPPDSHYRHRFPAEIICHAVWLYDVFSLSLRHVEIFLAESSVAVSYETVKRWRKKFGASFVTADSDAGHGHAAHVRGLHPRRAARFLAFRRLEWRRARHLRSGPARGQRREALLQAASEAFAVRARSIVTDKLRSYGVAQRHLLLGVEH